MIDVYVSEEYEEGFKVTDDKKADWCNEKIKEIEAEQNRLIMLAQDKIDELKLNYQGLSGGTEVLVLFSGGTRTIIQEE